MAISSPRPAGVIMHKDLVASAILLIIAGTYYLFVRDISTSTLEDAVGPTGLPTLLAALLALMALVIGLKALVWGSAPTTKDGDEEASWPRAMGMLFIGACYIPLATYVGYWIALAVLIIAVTLYEGMKPSLRMMAVAAGGATFFWILFAFVLGVRVPEAVLF